MKPDKSNKPASANSTAPSDGSEAEAAGAANWQTSVQRIYDRKHRERQPLKEGDPQRYRQVAAEIGARQATPNQTNDAILADGLVDDNTPIISGTYTSLPLPTPRDSYPHWRQITGTTFLEHDIIRGDASSQRVDFVFAKVAWEILQQFGLEAAYVFLLLTTKLLKAANPWEEIVELSTSDLLQLEIGDRDIGLGKRLRLAGNWFELVCNLSLLVNQIDSATGRFTALRIPFWVLEEMEYAGTVTHALGGYQPEEAQELTVRVGLGLWTEQFTDTAESAKHAGLMQFGQQAETILQIPPNRQPLRAKLAILLLLLDRLSPEASEFYAVGAILEQVDSKASLIEIHRRKDRRNTVFSRWNTTLRALQKLGWEIEFDPATYPIDLQPAWNHSDGQQPSVASSDEPWVDQWLQAKIRITPPPLVVPETVEDDLPLTERFTGKNLAQALEMRGLSRSKLAEHLHLDRSMVTYWIKGARLIQPRHREQICQLLGEELEQVIAS